MLSKFCINFINYREPDVQIKYDIYTLNKYFAYFRGNKETTALIKNLIKFFLHAREYVNNTIADSTESIKL